MRSAAALAEPEPPRMRPRDGHVPSRAAEVSARQRFWPVDAQPDVTDRAAGGRGLLYTWRRQIQEGMAAPAMPEARQPREAAQPSALQDRSGHVVERRVVSGVIEIDLPNGVCVRVDNHVDPVALRRVLDALLTR